MYMKLFLTLALLLTTSTTTYAEPVFRIEVGKDYKSYSNSDLQRRVWELERAVWQLQQRVFQLESEKEKNESAHIWSCTVSAMGESFIESGATEAEAKKNVMKACKTGTKDPFFCGTPRCQK